MKKPSRSEPRRVAISLDLDWGFKRHFEVYAGCQRHAEEAGWENFINPATGRMLADRTRPFPYDGVIARATSALARAALARGVPLVNVWNNSPAKGVPGVFPDWRAAGVMAATHLLSRGFRHFAYLGFMQDIDSRIQLQGMRETVEARGHDVSVLRIPRTSVSGTARGWQRTVREIGAWIDQWRCPIGVLASQDLLCRYLIDICRHKGLQVSQQVAIVGTHNETELCLSPPPSLTSIDMSYSQVGYRAAALLGRLMEGASPPQEPEWVPPAELVPRQSTDSCAAADPLVASALRFMAENSQRRIRVEDVAAAVSCGRRTLERHFRDSLGRAIADEITRLRLESAKRLLVETDAQIKNIAERCGFRSADHFCKVFARAEGMTPSSYRLRRQRAFPRES